MLGVAVLGMVLPVVLAILFVIWNVISFNILSRLAVGVTDVTIGIMTLLYPEWALHEISGMSVPYFFDEKYDDQTYDTWDGFDDLEEGEQLTHE